MSTPAAAVGPRPRRTGTGTKTIRVRADLHDRLQAIAAERCQPIGSVLEELVEERERREFFAQMGEAYRRLAADPAAAAAHDADGARWETTLADGLPDERWDEA